ncbi:hypothetical protein RN001_004457 [Aquatica leii]|uniref:Uncharacterized protein n=1 Tax=Aquatica leii TaxID=1421715 RepID=A0AAN7PBM7_9COLE|nr:hypothetical protein RN001_004457 [Aquatica leii]
MKETQLNSKQNSKLVANIKDITNNRKFLTLKELEDYWDDEANFEDINDDNATIDIVLLPPEQVDELSDLEELEENILEDTVPVDVPGTIEIHGLNHNEVERNNQSKTEKTISEWNKEKAQFTIPNERRDKCSSRKKNLIKGIRGKTPAEVFNYSLLMSYY